MTCRSAWHAALTRRETAWGERKDCRISPSKPRLEMKRR
jgi:hypothetical protein